MKFAQARGSGYTVSASFPYVAEDVMVAQYFRKKLEVFPFENQG